ncbi:hypothetical protein BDFB_003492 [Asbolus verrucosus]|uniref:HTH Tnp Tc3 2 domain containing protein n=1 Tax=Asbolus verrucosus TaxID=1661398 RepID=A0A482VQ86_ASBVE|nr:hypothetical protein BDFB_003492 [Asbolus verrucosus]
MTVMRWGRRWTEEANVRRRNGSGRPRVSSAREDQRLCMGAVRDRFSATRAIGNHWITATEGPISKTTIYRKIRSFGLRSYRCNGVVSGATTKVQEWDHVVFSDKSRFCQCTHDGSKRVRRFRGERQNPIFFGERQTARTPGVYGQSDSVGSDMSWE